MPTKKPTKKRSPRRPAIPWQELPPWKAPPPGRPEGEPPPTALDAALDHGLDPGIEWTVALLRSEGIETYQSCEGGAGHAYPEPTIEFSGDVGAGYRALGVCLAHGLPVSELRRVWSVADGHVVERAHWALVFSRRPG